MCVKFAIKFKLTDAFPFSIFTVWVRYVSVLFLFYSNVVTID